MTMKCAIIFVQKCLYAIAASDRRRATVLIKGAHLRFIRPVRAQTRRRIRRRQASRLAHAQKRGGHGAGRTCESLRPRCAQSVRIVDSKAPSFSSLFNIVKIDDLSNSTQTTRVILETALAKVAETSLAVVDEVHTLYRAALKTSTIRRFVCMTCPKFVCMTATPTPARGEAVEEKWLADTPGTQQIRRVPRPASTRRSHTYRPTMLPPGSSPRRRRPGS